MVVCISLCANTVVSRSFDLLADAVSLQLDMSFLAYALGLRVQVFHASHAGRSDSLRHYPDEGADHLPLVQLMQTGDPARYFVAVA